jgi:hypothetical protein
MINIKWEKCYTKYDTTIKHDMVCSGLYSYLCDIQDLTFLDKDKGETMNGKVINCKFPLSFTMFKTDNGYSLNSTCLISLKTYEELSYRIEKWGEYDSINKCMNKAISIVKGFQINFLTGKDNTGDYYKI